MITEILSAADPAAIARAAALIRAGELVAIPTETVYGLGANGLDTQAVQKIFQIKGRPGDNPLILHIAEPSDMEGLCHDIPAVAYTLAEQFWPGPLTMILPARELIPKATTAGLPTVGIRCPDCAATRQVIAQSGVPIAAPSANISGKPSTTTAAHVFHDHQGKLPLILDNGPSRVGLESTIVDLSEQPPRLLRPGGITLEMLLPYLPDLVTDKAVTAQLAPEDVVKAPGMKYRHYAPNAQVLIVRGSAESAARYIHDQYAPGDRVLCYNEELFLYTDCKALSYGFREKPETLSAGLYAALRELDDPGITRIFARCPEGGGILAAIGNRLGKAAAFMTVNGEDSL